METLKIEEFPCEMVNVPGVPGAQACKMSLPKMNPEDLPTVSIVTPTFNRKLFVDLMIRNWNVIDYPRSKLEWIIVDDGDEPIRNLLPRNNPQIRYIQIENKKKIPLGKKRNFLASLARHEIIVHMDDDDFYPPESVTARVKAIMVSKKDCVGCLKTLCYDLIHDQTFEAYDASVENKPATISESTLAYRKSFWHKQKYKDSDTYGECLAFIKNRQNQIIQIPYIFVVTQLSHSTNTIKRWVKQNTKHTVQFTDNLPMRDELMINDLRANIIRKFPDWAEAIDHVQKWTRNYLTKKQLDKKMIKLSPKLLGNPLVRDFIQNYKTKNSSSGKDLVYYCGPGKYLQFSNPWNSKSKILGGSEEAVVNISEELVKLGWNVIVYCVTPEGKSSKINNVCYKPYWEWLPKNKQDVTVIWRDPSIVDNKHPINSKKIILDLHDVIDRKWITPQRLDKFDSIVVKSKFHKIITSNHEKVVIIPNGIHSKLFKNNKKNKQKNIIINTSSPDRSLYALLKALPIIRQKIPDAEIHWAYGFKSGISEGGMEADGRKFVSDWVKKIKNLINKTPGFINLGRLSQIDVIGLYKKGNIFAYGTRFPEIDCISMTKALASGCTPVVTPNSALGDKMEMLDGQTVRIKSNLNVLDDEKIDYSIEEGEEFEKWVGKIINTLENPPSSNEKFEKFAQDNFDWSTVVNKWIQIITQG